MAKHSYNTNATRRRKRIKDKKITIYTKEWDNKNDVRLYIPVHPGKVWAYVRQLSGEEVLFAKQRDNVEDIQFVVNYRPDYADWYGIIYNGIYYHITRVDTYEGYKGELTVYASGDVRSYGKNNNPHVKYVEYRER